MAVPSAPSWAVVGKAVKPSFATTAASCGTQTRLVTKPGVSVLATRQEPMMFPHSMSSTRSLVVWHKHWGTNLTSVWCPLAKMFVLLLILKMQRRSSPVHVVVPTSWRLMMAAATEWTVQFVLVSSVGCACRRSQMCTTSGTHTYTHTHTIHTVIKLQ